MYVFFDFHKEKVNIFLNFLWGLQACRLTGLQAYRLTD